MLVRTATQADVDQIARVEAACFPVAEAATREEFQQRVARYGNHFLLMFDDGAPGADSPDDDQGLPLVSFVNGLVTNERDLIDEMYAHAEMHDERGAWQMIFGVCTLPAYRHRGLASTLVARVVADARAQHRKGVVLTCKDALVPYYTALGFSDEGMSRSTHGGVPWHQMRATF